MAERATFTYHEIQHGGGCHTEFPKMSVSLGQTMGNECKMTFSLHVAESISDNNNF